MRVLLGVRMGEHLVVDGGSVVRLNHCAHLGKARLVLGLLVRQHWSKKTISFDSSESGWKRKI